jgi:hypothetical protein
VIVRAIMHVLLWFTLTLAAASWVLMTFALVLGAEAIPLLALAVFSSLVAVELAYRVEPWKKEKEKDVVH